MRAKKVAAVGFAGLAVFAIAGCGSGKTGGGGGGTGILVGTTDKVTSLDPAKAYDNGSLLAETQVYQFLLNFPPATPPRNPMPPRSASSPPRPSTPARSSRA